MILAPIQMHGAVWFYLPMSELHSLSNSTQQLYAYMYSSFSICSAPCLAHACVITKYFMEAAVRKKKI